MLSKESLMEEYNSFKKSAVNAFHNNEIEESLALAQYAGSIAWLYPILFNFIDEELERLLEKIADKIIDQKKANSLKKQNEKRVVFYAGQLIDSGALTEQYLCFLIENDYKILLIVPFFRNTRFAKNTLKQIKKNSQVEIYIPGSRKLGSKIQDIYKKIIAFDPDLAFLHFLPNDVIGYCVFSQIKHIKKYYIVHNDHTFWLGKGCSDYFLEFRKFGYLLAMQRRKIDCNKIHLLPYYPINNNKEFQGFPFDKSDQVIGISGANLYKYLMDPELKYFHAIKKLLLENPNFIFCLCGWGSDVSKIQAIFNDINVNNRFHFLGKRMDFYSLVGNSDILFESYPLKGGLTVLFATEQGKAIVGISNNKNASGSTQDLLELNDYEEPTNIENFIKEADLLIKNSSVREANIIKFANNKFNKEDFDKKLKLIIDQKEISDIPLYNSPLKLDDDYFLNEYIKMDDSPILFLQNKLFSSLRVLKFQERINLVWNIFCSDKKFTFREYLRLFVTIFGV